MTAIRNWTRPTTDGRLASENRDRYVAQSAGVKFGLLPERQADIEQLAREIRAATSADSPLTDSPLTETQQ